MIKKEKTQEMTDKKNPTHYVTFPIQPIEYIVANDLNFCEGNIVKYITRWRLKGGIEDLIKAQRYIEFLIAKANEEPLVFKSEIQKKKGKLNEK